MKPELSSLVEKSEHFQVHLRKSIKHNIFSAKRRKQNQDDIEFSSTSLNSANGIPGDADAIAKAFHQRLMQLFPDLLSPQISDVLPRPAPNRFRV